MQQDIFNTPQMEFRRSRASCYRSGCLLVLLIGLLFLLYGMLIHGFAEGVFWLGRWSYKTIQVVMWCLVFIVVIMMPWRWLWAYRLYGPGFRAATARTWSIMAVTGVVKSVRMYLLRSAVIVVILAGIWCVTRSRSVLPFALFFCLGMPLILTKYYLPPGVLLLGASSKRTLILQRVLMDHLLSVQRVVSLLVPMDPSPMAVEEPYESELLRTWDEEKWFQVVEDLMDIAPVVVLDCRTTTRLVEHEARRLLILGRAHKALLVVGSQGERPAIDRSNTASALGSTAAAEVTEDRLPEFLRRLLLPRGIRPSADNTIGDIANESEVTENRPPYIGILRRFKR